MPRLFRRVHKKPALPPGTLEYVGEKKVEQVRVTVMDYREEHFEEKDVATVEECFPFKESPTVTWINITGLHETGMIKALGEHFGLHPLVLEDIVNTQQRPKMEDFHDYIYLVLRMIEFEENEELIRSEQISVILGRNYVLSFQEKEGDVFGPVRERIRKGKGRARRLGPDYLAYALLDAIVDEYFVVLERMGNKIESLEEDMVDRPTPELLQTIHTLKREMILLRKSVWPLREVLSSLERAESKLIHKTTGPFLRDVYDHTIQVIDAVESFRDMLSGMQDLYLSSISNKMNEVMKVLTIFATIFIPLTFVAGIYGMNFEFMPELGWRWSYPLFWGAIGAIAGSMFVYFRRKRWL
jgi:magnesium transporter